MKVKQKSQSFYVTTQVFQDEFTVYNQKDVYNCKVNCTSFWSDFKSRWLSLASTLHHHFTALNVVKIKFMSLPRQYLEEKSGKARRRHEVQKFEKSMQSMQSKHFKRHDDTSVDSCRLHSLPASISSSLYRVKMIAKSRVKANG